MAWHQHTGKPKCRLMAVSYHLTNFWCEVDFEKKEKTLCRSSIITCGSQSKCHTQKTWSGEKMRTVTFWSTMEHAISRTCARLKSQESNITGSRLNPIWIWKEMPWDPARGLGGRITGGALMKSPSVKAIVTGHCCLFKVNWSKALWPLRTRNEQH